MDTFLEQKTYTIAVPVLKRGCKGESVKALQAHLRGCGYGLEIDGSFGGATETAVKDYQQKFGLTADGVVGLQTGKHLLGLG